LDSFKNDADELCHLYLGVTPILQVLRAVLHDEEDTATKVYLLTSNKTEDDILCREELDSYTNVQPAGRYRIHHQLTRVPAPVPALPVISDEDSEGEDERGSEDEGEGKGEGDSGDEADADAEEGEDPAEEESGGEAASVDRGDSHGENRSQTQNENERRWTGGFGRITNQTIVDHFPPPNEDALVLACGPDGLIETVKRCMEAVGWDLEKSLVVF
jgi:ferredoxin-NADP reductase